MRSKVFTYLSIFMLFTLMLLKVTSLHIYTHNDSTDKIENCETCYFSFQNQKIDFSVTTFIVLTTLTLVLHKKKHIRRTTIDFSSLNLISTRFGRPPPYLR